MAGPAWSPGLSRESAPVTLPSCAEPPSERSPEARLGCPPALPASCRTGLLRPHRSQENPPTPRHYETRPETHLPCRRCAEHLLRYRPKPRPARAAQRHEREDAEG